MGSDRPHLDPEPERLRKAAADLRLMYGADTGASVRLDRAAARIAELEAALSAAGWTLAPPGSRIVPEGGVDEEALERAAKAISRMIPLYGESWLEPHGHNFPEQYSDREQRLIYRIAETALRALAEAKP